MRCKNCKQKFEPIRFNMKYCTEAICLRAFSDEIKLKTWQKTKKKMKAELETVQDIVKAAQIVFNKYIRERDKNETCISCGKPIRKGNVDAGHLWSAGGHSNLRFNEFNVNAQCSRPCNKDKSGDINNYRLGFIKRYGEDKLSELDSIAHTERKFTKDELKLLIIEYKQKTKELEK
jgi:hypothetical protein